MATKSSKYLRPKQAAEIIGVCEKTICVLYDSGKLQGYRIDTKRRDRRIDPMSVIEFMNKSRSPDGMG